MLKTTTGSTIDTVPRTLLPQLSRKIRHGFFENNVPLGVSSEGIVIVFVLLMVKVDGTCVGDPRGVSGQRDFQNTLRRPSTPPFPVSFTLIVLLT